MRGDATVVQLNAQRDSEHDWRARGGAPRVLVDATARVGGAAATIAAAGSGEGGGAAAAAALELEA